ncbi:MAG: DNA recombination protein RmuC [Bacteroidaceae bacterium]|nr:DNA recombination protein RmuC [Bacteroidaceae bacterium]
MVYILASIGTIIGFLIGYFMMRAQKSAVETRCEMLSQMLSTKEAEHNKQIADIKEQRTKELGTFMDQQGKLTAGIRDQYGREIENIKNQYEQQIDDMKIACERRISELKAQHDKNLEEMRVQQKEQMQQQMDIMREQVNTTSEKILQERSEQLSIKNKEQLSQILNPLQNGIQQMREAVEKTGRESATTMERLDASIKSTIEKATQLSDSADKLTMALTGENKAQGNFGEVKLKQLLEDMGLEEGVQFEEQTTLKDANGKVIYDEQDGHRLIPDVILHFPDKRDVIIDSKMSLTAFVEYQNAATDEERQNALKRHIASVRAHVNELARKNYSSYIKEGHGKLDFVMMYVFQESALQLAVANEPTIWKEAYDKGVVISGSQNLYMMLRVLEMTWKQVRQIENQEEIMKCANTIIDRVQLFYERFQKVEECFSKAQDAIKEVKSSTAPGGVSITTAASNLLKFGAQENPKRKKRLPQANNELETCNDSDDKE